MVLELDWFPLRADKHEPLLLCIAGADGSFRLLEIYRCDIPTLILCRGLLIVVEHTITSLSLQYSALLLKTIG